MTKSYVRYGSSPRGVQAIILGAKILALLDNRYAVATDDIQNFAVPALRHRLILSFEGEAEGIDPDEIISDVLKHTPVTP